VRITQRSHACYTSLETTSYGSMAVTVTMTMKMKMIVGRGEE
jgi:hypothetical protein